MILPTCSASSSALVADACRLLGNWHGAHPGRHRRWLAAADLVSADRSERARRGWSIARSRLTSRRVHMPPSNLTLADNGNLADDGPAITL
jgi:hypothetical protein